MADIEMSFVELLDTASRLLSERGDTPQYDRVVAEVCCALVGWQTDSVESMQEMLRGYRKLQDGRATPVQPLQPLQPLQRFQRPNNGWTDHSHDVAYLRDTAGGMTPGVIQTTYNTAADLLEAHDATDISLDDWVSARGLVEMLIGKAITENGV
jgi:hypothetical protein